MSAILTILAALTPLQICLTIIAVVFSAVIIFGVAGWGFYHAFCGVVDMFRKNEPDEPEPPYEVTEDITKVFNILNRSACFFESVDVDPKDEPITARAAQITIMHQDDEEDHNYLMQDALDELHENKSYASI